MRALVLAMLLVACQRDEAISRDLGGACRGPDDCNARCLPDPTWPSGFCTHDCRHETDCPLGAVCITTTEGAVCLFSCMDDRECEFLDANGASTWKCLEREGEGLPKLVCAPGSGVAADAGAADAL